MMRIGTLEASLGNRRRLSTPSGTGYYKSDIILSTPDDAIAPQAFLVEQEANSTIGAHFHKENQFQVIVGGGGMLGRHAVAPISVHYANRHTGYGPVQSGEEGVSYLTLRDHVTAEAYYLPESRAVMENLPRRNVFAEQLPKATAESLQARVSCEISPVIAPETDGLAAWVVRIPPSGTAPLPEVGGARFHLVIAGSLNFETEDLPWLTTLFTSEEEAPLTLRASPAGCEVLVLQYPRASGRSREGATLP